MIAVLMKVVDLRVEVDPLTGEPAAHSSSQALGASPADHAALETALQLAGSEPVMVVTACSAAAADAADAVLREWIAAGATRVVRLELADGASSAEVAAAIAPVVAEARLVVCGDASLDRGSGAVPAFVAHHLKAAQALGLTSVTRSAGGALRAERRLDGGRREVLEVSAPAVLSVEAGLRLRRAPLAALIRARDTVVEVVTGPLTAHGEPPAERLRPYRAPAPGASSQPSPADPRERVLALTGMLAPTRARRVVEADPATCVDELLDYLVAHGYR